MAALPVRRILPSIVPSVLEGRDQWLDSAEILVVAAPFIRQQRMDGMMEVIAPLRVKPITAVSPVEEQSRVVQIVSSMVSNGSGSCYGPMSPPVRPRGLTKTCSEQSK